MSAEQDRGSAGWAYVIGDTVPDGRGTIYAGENERVSKLYLFFP
jgi:hypothetical protein